MHTAAVYTYSVLTNQEAICRQRERCQALARTLGCQTMIPFEDEAGDRTALDALLEHANAGRIDVVVASHIDRFGRHPLDLLRVLDALDRASVEVHTVTGGRIDTADRYPWRAAVMIVSASGQRQGSATCRGV